jgi:hypothetical protein
MYKIKRFFKRIKNLARWFPIIWNDQDWDQWYIYEILKFKLKNQAEYIGYHNRHTRAQRDAQIMRLCVTLIDKLQNEWYSGEYQDYHKPKFNWNDSETQPGYFELDIEEDPNERFDEYFKKYPRIYKQVINDPKPRYSLDTKSSIALNVAHINEERAHKLLFTILERNIRRWWD